MVPSSAATGARLGTTASISVSRGPRLVGRVSCRRKVSPVMAPPANSRRMVPQPPWVSKESTWVVAVGARGGRADRDVVRGGGAVVDRQAGGLVALRGLVGVGVEEGVVHVGPGQGSQFLQRVRGVQQAEEGVARAAVGPLVGSGRGEEVGRAGVA